MTDLLDDAIKTILSREDPVIDTLCDAAKRHENPFKTTGFCQLTIKLKDGKFKKAKFSPDEEFFFDSVYQGKRDGLIFCFKPVDAKPFEQAELNEKEIKNLPGFEAFLVETLGAEPGAAFGAVKARIIKLAAQRKKKAETEKAKVEEKELVSRYGDDPLWGIF